MSGPQSNEPGQPERTPFFQRVLDNPFLLLFLGVTIPTVRLYHLGDHGDHPDSPRRTLTGTAAMAIAPPSERIWWKEPIHKVELVWIIVAFLWGLAMFFMMIYWHGVGSRTSRTRPTGSSRPAYAAKVDKMIASSTRCERRARFRSCARRPAATST